MRVVKVYPESVQIEINRSSIEFVPEYDRPIPGDSASLLHTLAQFRMTHNKDGTPAKISPGAAWMMGMNGHSEQVITTTTIYLLHPPNKTRVDCYAVPISKTFWDYGIPYNGDSSQFQYIYRVLTNGIIRERQYTPKEQIEQKGKLVAHQLEQASNNLPSFQFEVGKRYLIGDGVPTNKILGDYWINLAASNSSPEAIKFLSERGDSRH